MKCKNFIGLWQFHLVFFILPAGGCIGHSSAVSAARGARDDKLAGMKKSNRIIALDGDGVLLDYHAAYRANWAKAFGSLPAIRDPQAYWPMDRYEVKRLDVAERAHFRQFFDEEFWSTVPAIPGALAACETLVAAGYELVCVSAVETRFEAARLRNLQDHGFAIDRVIAAPHVSGEAITSPKAAALQQLQPLAFVDDYLPYLRGIPAQIHAALILREPVGSPNVGAELARANSQHADLADFSRWWLKKDVLRELDSCL